MTVYKYTTKKGIRWRYVVRYKETSGNAVQTQKRGFLRRSDALEAERQFLEGIKLTSDALLLPWPEFCDVYLNSLNPSLSPQTLQTKKYRYRNHIKPAFSVPVVEVTPPMIDDWTNELLKIYSLKHVKNLYGELRTVFNYAERLYGLSPNPIKKITPPRKKELHKQMDFWTLEEFNAVLEAVDDLKARTAFIVFFYTGIRKGELLALKWRDIEGATLHITKTLARINGKTIITAPKSASSVRTILLPDIVIEALDKWHKANYAHDSYIFEWEKRFIEKARDKACKQTGIKKIRVHDLRHSHVSYLISKGANINLISKRLGHSKVSMTLDIYGHLYPNEEYKIIDLINQDN